MFDLEWCFIWQGAIRMLPKPLSGSTVTFDLSLERSLSKGVVYLSDGRLSFLTLIMN